MTKISWYYKIWKEGKYLDFWSVPHFTIGLLLGFVFLYFQLNIIYALLATFLIKFCWEIFEHFYGIKEFLPNKIFDILLAILAVGLLYFISNFYILTLKTFIITLIFHVIIGGWGSYANLKKRREITPELYD